MCTRDQVFGTELWNDLNDDDMAKKKADYALSLAGTPLWQSLANVKGVYLDWE